jgi:UDPglucose 6-dehydrogenase
MQRDSSSAEVRMAGGRRTEREPATGDIVGVVGLGVVGATIARAFREAGVEVHGYDPYLGVGAAADLAPCGVVFLCVPTPGVARNGYDLTEVWSAMSEIEPHLGAGAIVAIKSTVPPGTCDTLADAFGGVEIVSVPEFLVAGQPWESFTRPDRIVIGARSKAAGQAVAALMGRVAPLAPAVILERPEAELVKLCSNAMLAAKVSMANELAEVCGRFGVAWSRVQGVVGLDRRIGPDHLTVTPERGFGGQCLPKDLDGLIGASNHAGYAPALLEELARFNRAIRAEEPEAADGAAEMVQSGAADAS